MEGIIQKKISFPDVAPLWKWILFPSFVYVQKYQVLLHW